MKRLEPRFVRFVRSRGLVRPGDRVLIALSGGVDSMVLLHLLHAAAERLRIELHAAHFDHAMRADSAADAQWVASICEALGVPLISARATHVLRGETEARTARYHFLEDAARRSGSSRIATAHHADDQVETILFRLLRGTGTRGLAGIPVRRGSFVRPLLRFGKQDLLTYAAANGIAFREDPTNEQLDYARNRIRRIVIPALERAQPAARASILALGRHSARTEAAWRSAVVALENEVVMARENDAIQLARPVLLEYHPELRARVLRHELRPFGVIPSRAQTRHLVEFCENAESGASLIVARNVRVERAFDRLSILRSARRDATDSSFVISDATGNVEWSAGGRVYSVAWWIGERAVDAEAFDPALLASGGTLRTWRAGDRIRLPYGTKKLKKLFAEHRVAVSERARIPVLTDSHGRVLWVVGVARSIDALPDAKAPVLNIRVQNAESR